MLFGHLKIGVELRLSSSTDEAISIVLFMGKDCAPCKIVKKHLDKILDTAGSFHINFLQIDTEKHPALRDKYGIVNVPEVLIDNKTVLSASEASELLGSSGSSGALAEMMGFDAGSTTTMGAPDVLSFDSGGMEDQGEGFGSIFAGSGAEVFNHLFNALIEARVDREERDLPANMKNNMLQISSNALKAIDEEGDMIRPAIGDYVHIGVLQAIVTSMMSISASSIRYIYRAGNLMGRFGATQTKLFEYNPRIFDQFEPSKRFREIVTGLGKMYDATKDLFPTFLSSGAKVMRSGTRSATIRIYGSAISTHAVDIQTPLCNFTAGDIAGMVETQLGEQCSVKETACWGLGDEFCEFELKLGEESSFEIASEDDKEFMSEKRSEMFENCLSTISQNTYESVLMQRVLRPGVGDYVHITVLQQVLNGLKFADPFNSTLLYYAGAHYGRLGVDKVVLQSILFQEDSPYKLPLDFEDGIKVLEAYFNDPRTILQRNHGNVYVKFIDDETAHVKIMECATASGSGSLQQPLVDIHGQEKEEEKIPLCDFTAGFIHGRLDLLLDEDVRVKEIECHSTGHNHCLFEVVLD